LADPSHDAGGWTFRPVPPTPRSIVESIRGGTLDAGLAATLWVLVEARVPFIVAADAPGTGASTLLETLLEFLPDRVQRVDLAGATESFEWLPQASELGWPGTAHAGDGPPVRPDSTVLVAAALSDDLPSYTWGERARIAVRATAVGYGLAATIRADSLDEVLDGLGRAPVSLTEDEVSFLGCVLILRRVDGARRRVVAAHYVRPTVRDAHGHTQRLGPAVLATWDPARDAFEDFSWGIAPELAFRIGWRPGDLELEVGRRRDLLAGLAMDGTVEIGAVRAAIRHVTATSIAGSPQAAAPDRG